MDVPTFRKVLRILLRRYRPRNWAEGLGAAAASRAGALVRVLRPAGLARQKVPKIRRIARILIEESGGSMDAFLQAPAPKAREMLLALPDVGPKTADVWLSLVAGRGTMP